MVVVVRAVDTWAINTCRRQYTWSLPYVRSSVCAVVAMLAAHRIVLRSCARLDLLGFELCSPEVLLDLQDLDHELSPTTRELVQVLASPLMRMTKLRATRARPRLHYMGSTITTLHIAHRHHDVMKIYIGFTISTKTSFGVEYRSSFCIL